MTQQSEMVIIIRPSFKKVCGPDACRAGLYNHILYRLAKKAKNEPEKDVREGNIFWFASAEDICQDIDEAWCVNKVRKEVNKLVDGGLLGQRHNPIKKWDRKFQYFISEEQGKKLLERCEAEGICLLHIGLNAEVLHLLHMVNAFNKNGGCICQKEEMELPNMGNASTINGGAIPEGSQPKGSTEGSQKEKETFADCLTYLEQQGVAPRGDDAVQIMAQARTLYAHKHPRYEYRARPGLSEHPDDQLPSKTEAFIEKLREWRIEDEQPEEDITQAETVKVQVVSKQNTSTPTPAQVSPPQSEQAALEQTAQQNHSAVTPCSADDIKNRRFQMATPDVPLPETCSVPASTRTAEYDPRLTPSQSGVNSRATHGTTDIFSQMSTKTDVPPSGVPPTKGKGKKQAEPKSETPKGPPAEPPSDMAWGTRKCLLWFDYWRGGILIGKFKLMQASTCAKGLAEQFSEEQVIQARTDMEADPYYIGKGGCDVCDVANNIHKYLKRKQQTKKPAQSTNAAQSQPITNIRELVRQREARLTAAAVQVGV